MVSDSLDRRRFTELIEAARIGCQTAWTELVCLILPPIRLWLGRGDLQAADVDELTQDVLLTVYRSLATFDHQHARANFHGWLKAITLNRFQDWRRLQIRRREVVLNDSQSILLANFGESLGPETEALQRCSTVVHHLDAILAMRTEFQPSSWDAFWRMVVHADSASDIAAQTRVSASSIRQAKYRVLIRLRQRLSA